jgi:hypothetical protein
VTTPGRDVSELVHELRSIAGAYPEDIFGPVTDAEIKEHASLITRNSAAMGRHLGQFLTKAADEIEAAHARAERMQAAITTVLYNENIMSSADVQLLRAALAQEKTHGP